MCSESSKGNRLLCTFNFSSMHACARRSYLNTEESSLLQWGTERWRPQLNYNNHKLFLEICQIPYLRSRGEISHTQNTCEATGGRERFSAMIVFIVPAMVFLPSSRLSRRPDFSTKKTATVNATNTKKKNRQRHFTTCTCTTTCISIYTRSQLQIISFIAGQGLKKIGFKIFLWVRRPHSLRVQGRFLLA